MKIFFTFPLEFVHQQRGSINKVSEVDVVHVEDRHRLQPVPLHQTDQPDLPALPLQDVRHLASPQRCSCLGVSHVGDDPGKLRHLLISREPLQTIVCQQYQSKKLEQHVWYQPFKICEDKHNKSQRPIYFYVIYV